MSTNTQSPASSKASELNLDHLEKVAKRGDYITKAEVLTLIALARKGMAAEAPDAEAALPVAAPEIKRWQDRMPQEVRQIGTASSEAAYKDAEIADLRAALQQRQAPALNCPKCSGTGEMDSGGTMPWGAPALIRCDCQEPGYLADQLEEIYAYPGEASPLRDCAEWKALRATVDEYMALLDTVDRALKGHPADAAEGKEEK